MPSFNRVVIAGNLTRDVEVKTIGSGDTVASFGLAINRKWKGSDGQPREEVCFIDCTAWQKRAELIAQYFHKGSPILIEGRLKFDQWEDESGNKRSKHTVVVDQFSFCGGREEKEDAEPAATTANQSLNNNARRTAPVIDDDGIPF